MNLNAPVRSSMRQRVALLLLGALSVACVGRQGAMSKAAAEEAPAAGDDLSIEQARLADRFERLEIVMGRLAELSAGSDPRRARLLRDALAESREQDVHQRFETIVTLLEEERLSAAGKNQTELQKELDALLTLLLKTDRDSEMESEARRIRKYLQEVSRLLRLQKGLRARTEGGDTFKPLSDDQQKLADQTGELGGKIAETDGSQSESGAETPPSDADKSPGDQTDKPSDKSSEDKPGDSSKPSPSDGQPSESGDSPPSQPSPSGGQPPPSGGQSSGDAQPQQQSSQQQQPADRAAERLRAAQQRMKQARQQLDQAEREGAAQEQREALKELERAKAELERVLRQLREEELERMLTLLAARFRRMLEAQIKVYDGTVHLGSRDESARDHNYEIEAARLSREESLIVREADRAMVLLREEGSSVAFPEAVEQMREDMMQVVLRLADLKVGVITQELEQDIIAALEETIAALEKALRDLDKNRMSRPMPPGQPTEPPLVDKLAELKMIRSLQMRINRRTQRYGEMIANQDAETPELLEALARLAERQKRVYQATSDLSQGRNN